MDRKRYIKKKYNRGDDEVSRAYDERLINRNINRFRNKGYSARDITIYFDLDNTLALFNVKGEQEQALINMYNKGFYENLYCFPEVPSVLYQLKASGFNVKILSSCIDTPYCKREKRKWVKKYLPFIDSKDIILLPNGEQKSKYIKNVERAILVDDYCENLKDIYKNGGIGIKKTYSNKQRPIPQVCSLTEIFDVLNLLNCAY